MAEIAGLFLGAAALIPIFFETGDAIVTKAESNRKAKAIAENLQIFTVPESRALLKLDFLNAQAILNHAEISLEDKSNIQSIFGRGMILLREMNKLTDAVLEHQGIFKSKRKRAHLKLQEKTVQLKETMGNLHQMVIVLRQIRESTATFFLEDQDFQIVIAGKHLSIASHDIFIAEGRPARKIENCEPIVNSFLFEPKPYASHHQKSVKKDMRALSRKLSAAERSVGKLPIVGFREVPEDQVFQLVFGLPSNRSLTATLRSMYQQTCSQPSLNIRVDLCRQLAEAVLHTHSLGLVHKNIRPANLPLLSQSRQDSL